MAAEFGSGMCCIQGNSACGNARSLALSSGSRSCLRLRGRAIADLSHKDHDQVPRSGARLLVLEPDGPA